MERKERGNLLYSRFNNMMMVRWCVDRRIIGSPFPITNKQEDCIKQTHISPFPSSFLFLPLFYLSNVPKHFVLCCCVRSDELEPKVRKEIDALKKCKRSLIQRKNRYSQIQLWSFCLVVGYFFLWKFIASFDQPWLLEFHWNKRNISHHLRHLAKMEWVKLNVYRHLVSIKNWWRKPDLLSFKKLNEEKLVSSFYQ